MTNEYGFEIPLVSEEECKLQERIEELEKENEELKEINEGYCRNRDRLISIGFPTFKDCKEYAEHLTKAREIILKLYNAGRDVLMCRAEEMTYKDGFKDGYNKANEWHKVAHGDLPSEECGWVCNQDGLPCFFDWGTEQWLDCEGTQIRTTEWCHMPHKE